MTGFLKTAWRAAFVTAALLAVNGLHAQTVSAADVAFFETKVRPVLADKCFACHGDKEQKGGVRLDNRAELLKDASSLKVVVPGNPDASALVHVLRYDGKIQMPPGGKLPQAQIDAITDWVKRGAPWPNAPSAKSGFRPDQKNFWSFQPIKKSPLPTVKTKGWALSPIDTFILSGLEKKGLKPAAMADRRTLIRRATFDLTGLPPTENEVSAFLADRSPDAYKKVVDRLLSSKRYGERWGRHWLDVARYADSADARGLGSEGDISEAWRYRDWVVSAFNSDMGYDKFVMNQVAGDLLPDPVNPRASLNISGTIATGLLAIGNWGNGDADKEKIVTDIADDQVDIIGKGFLGLTLGCARCHDHKFDPIPTKDYYGLAGIFFSSHILPRLTPKGQGEVMLRIPLETAETRAARAAYDKKLAEANTTLASTTEAAIASVAQQRQARTADYLAAIAEFRQAARAGKPISLAQLAANHGLEPRVLERWDASARGGDYPLMMMASGNTGGKAGVFTWKGAADCPNLVVNTNPATVSFSTITLPGKCVAVHPGPANGVAVEWVCPADTTVSITGKVADADPNGGDGIAWAVDLQSAAGPQELANGAFPNGGNQQFSAGMGAAALKQITVHKGDRLQFVVLPKAEYTCDTTVISAVIKATGGKTWDLTNDLLDNPTKENPRADSYGNAGVWRFADLGTIRRENRLSGAAGRAILAYLNAHSPAEQAAAAAAEAKALLPTDPANPFRPAPGDLKELSQADQAKIAALTASLDQLKKSAPPAPGIANGIQEGGIPDCPTSGIHDVRVHIRGRYDRLGDMVPRHFPIIVAGEKQPAITQGSGRLDLAKWLVSASNPLPARVMVNRIWQHHFGDGIVRTPSNFGFLGDRPSNPALLDWLAYEFRQPVTASDPYACGWSMKRMHRLIMLSAVYRQSSHLDPAAMRIDPDNRYFGRFNRQRLEAEGVRDALMAAAGTLDTQALDKEMGGMATRDFNAPRRTLYVMTIRSDRSGYGPLFDTADPTNSVEKRVTSTVAPQALFLMNSDFVGKQSRALAELVLKQNLNTDKDRVAWLYTRLYGRPVTAKEAVIALAYLGKSRAAAAHPAAFSAADAGTDAQIKLWQGYCGILLCANEMIYFD